MSGAHCPKFPVCMKVSDQPRLPACDKFDCPGRPSFLVPMDKPAEPEAILSHEDACRLSRSFNENCNLQTPQDYRINEWLKQLIALSHKEGGK